MDNKYIDEIENSFLKGDVEDLKKQRCPFCVGALFFSVSKVSESRQAEPGRRWKSGISIYCDGQCKKLLSHMDGFCPSWAEDIEDWERFSADLYQ
jgi:hypothetical protein